MPSIEELRARSRKSKELQEQKVLRVKDVVSEVVNSSSFALTMANQLGTVEPEKLPQTTVDQFATSVATSVVQQIDDPVNNFMDACRSKGLKNSVIRKAVESVSKQFGIEVDSEYPIKLEAVALYCLENPKLFEDFVLFR